MPRRIVISGHLSVAELEQRYRKAADPVASRHWQIVWLLAQGRTGQAVAASTGYSTRWIGQLAPAMPKRMPPPRRLFPNSRGGRCPRPTGAPARAGRELGDGRTPRRTETDLAARVGPAGPARAGGRPPTLRVGVRVRVRSAPEGNHALAAAA